jgi:glycine/D-amino acid oxidase-like deaminating enzyme
VTGLLARLLERTSLNIQTYTPVTSISSTEGGKCIIKTPRGSINSQKVIYATNAYTAGVLPEYAKKITPTKITCSHISVPKDSEILPPHLCNTYGVSYGASVRDYIIPRPDGGVICGGAKHTYIEDQSLWFNNFDDSTLIEPARYHFERVMQDNFRGWEKSGATVDYLWTGSKSLSPLSVICKTAPRYNTYTIIQ